jgi:hypothetical protein
LQLNRAFAADLEPGAPVLSEWPLPYRPMARILATSGENGFLGNPRRHFQHYATRMSGPRSETRTWRAWACWALARKILPSLPADEEQIAKEGVVEPGLPEIGEKLRELGLPGEAELWRAVLAEDALEA